MKTITFFPKFENFHELKDVSLIGDLLLDGNRQHFIVTSNTVDRQDIMPVPKLNKFQAIVIVKILPKFCRGDFLVLFHETWTTLIILILVRMWSFIWRLKIKIIVKADVNSLRVSDKRFIPYLKTNLIIILSDLFLYENKNLEKSISFKGLLKKTMLFINYPPDYEKFLTVGKELQNKSKITLVIGRHGSHQKNSEMILDQFNELRSKKMGYLVFVGPSSVEFTKKFNEISKNNEYVKLLGNISCREEYRKLLSEADFSLHCSLWEGGNPLASADALLSGLCLVGLDRLEFLGRFRDMGLLSSSHVSIPDALNYIHSNNIDNDQRKKSRERFHNLIEAQRCELRIKLNAMIME